MYTLEVSAPGFKTTRQKEIDLNAGDTVAADVVLTIGASEQIAVNASGPLLQTQDANISTELESKQIEELPLNLRNVLSFVTLNSAVNTQGDRQLLGAGGSEDTGRPGLLIHEFWRRLLREQPVPSGGRL